MSAGVRITPTTYTVCGLPADDVNAAVWRITIEERGPDSWAVCHLGSCLNRDGEWDYEPTPSNRYDDWLAEHRFLLGKALDLAVAAYPRLVINGLRVENGKLVHA